MGQRDTEGQVRLAGKWGSLERDPFCILQEWGLKAWGQGELYGVVLQYKRKPPFRDCPVRQNSLHVEMNVKVMYVTSWLSDGIDYLKERTNPPFAI